MPLVRLAGVTAQHCLPTRRDLLLPHFVSIVLVRQCYVTLELAVSVVRRRVPARHFQLFQKLLLAFERVRYRMRCCVAGAQLVRAVAVQGRHLGQKRMRPILARQCPIDAKVNKKEVKNDKIVLEFGSRTLRTRESSWTRIPFAGHCCR